MGQDGELFERLQNRTGITALIGHTENLHLDCKTWPQNEADGQKILAKAFAGFANADGVVVFIGIETEKAQKYDPDLITGEKPVADAIALKARIEALVGEFVEPPSRGVRLTAVPDQADSKAGFVLVHVPAQDGFPARSRKTGLFHVRSGSGTHPLEYFQMADMFGRRRRPCLEMYLDEIKTAAQGVGLPVERVMTLGLRNTGRGIARFPSIRLRTSQLYVISSGVDRLATLRRLEADPGIIAFGGGGD